jgi:hypothetical protein
MKKSEIGRNCKSDGNEIMVGVVALLVSMGSYSHAEESKAESDIPKALNSCKLDASSPPVHWNQESQANS